MSDDQTLQREPTKPAPVVREPETSVPEVKADNQATRAEAHKAGVEAVERALSAPA